MVGSMKMQGTLNALLFSAATIGIFVHEHTLGWILLILGVLHLKLCGLEYLRTQILTYSSIAILGLVGMGTDLDLQSILIMGSALIASVALPYIVSKYYFKEDWITFPIVFRGIWSRRRVLYIGLGMGVAYLLIPYYLRDTGAWQNWSFDPTLKDTLLLLIGMLVVGAWDELYFVNTVMRLFRKTYGFWTSNLLQAVVFASLLYELGFRGWGFQMIFLFALIQGGIYHRTKSLVYLITVHLCIDAVLWAAMVHAHYPHLMPIF